VVRTAPTFYADFKQTIAAEYGAGNTQGLTLVSQFDAGASASPYPFLLQGALLRDNVMGANYMNVVWYNRETQATWILIFEAPAGEWEAVWNAFGNVMCTKLRLNPQF